MRNFAILLGGAMALAACSSNPPPAPVAVAPGPMDMSNPLMAPGYMAMAASSDQFEVQSSQLAQQMSQNQQVRNFANLLISDHTRSTQMLAATAQSAGLTPPPPTLLPPQQAMLDQLRAAGSGPAFDAAFKAAQVNAHQQALALQQNYGANGDVPALRSFALTAAVPMIQMHLSQAQMLNVNPPAPPAPMPMPSTGRAGERG